MAPEIAKPFRTLIGKLKFILFNESRKLLRFQIITLENPMWKARMAADGGTLDQHACHCSSENDVPLEG